VNRVTVYLAKIDWVTDKIGTYYDRLYEVF
jgi:hypothetical protein